MIEAVDLFCGSGGLTCGLRRSGVKVIAGVDFENECQYPYEKNNAAKFLNWDIAKTQAADVTALYSKGAVRVLAGCAPCQPFSKYNNGVDTSLSEKWWLLYSFQRIIEGVMPEIIVMENVTDVVRHKVYHDFVSHLKNLGYHVSENNVSCVDYGIPQKRKRQIVLCSRFGPINLLSKTHETPVTVREAIGHLPRIESGEVDPSDPLHRAAKLSEVNLKRIKASVAGGTWRDWPEELRIGAHKRLLVQHTLQSIVGWNGTNQHRRLPRSATDLEWAFRSPRTGSGNFSARSSNLPDIPRRLCFLW